MTDAADGGCGEGVPAKPGREASPESSDAGSLLIYAPVPVFQDGQTTFVEKQASNGIRLWAENFDRVVIVMPVVSSPPNDGWIPLGEAGLPANVRMEFLPSAYRPDRFLAAMPAARRKIRSLIRDADFMSFAIGGLFGDWGAVCALEAHRMNRPFAVWTDRVESEVVRRTASQGSVRSRLRARLTHRPMAWLERFVIRRATLGLFHGRETYDAYARYCGDPHVVHDIHLAREDHLGPAATERKAAGCSEGPLTIAYAGRADAMKAPLDWVAVLEELAGEGIDFRATWLGDGELFAAMRSRIELSGLGDRISTPGFVTDRSVVLETMRASHLFLFCHTTPESPRCLIEALASSCPPVGYGSAFAEDLIAGNKGGELVPLGDVEALAKAVARLARDRAALADLIRRAALDGAPFDDVSVFRHRSDLIKTRVGQS